eukprot:CAMPEP_0114431154 /NCGR_PEP_ID=MMETSP0103-20121206/10445_1 /TAXON_ID=37642 ORGANISM="Paraphysomonas imperforata, Strain PA2" /NCGR_SAMPLE_ID=MMETSP0103 /ASSEMBLY_ACC=CAM_ASM_000201 /LENGTH=142 /DNA_ID=CAMNT_0001600693 /DNA_START=272 /DNA_END=701 /DNA_ORIENTATION=+
MTALGPLACAQAKNATAPFVGGRGQVSAMQQQQQRQQVVTAIVLRVLHHRPLVGQVRQVHPRRQQLPQRRAVPRPRLVLKYHAHRRRHAELICGGTVVRVGAGSQQQRHQARPTLARRHLQRLAQDMPVGDWRRASAGQRLQ